MLRAAKSSPRILGCSFVAASDVAVRGYRLHRRPCNATGVPSVRWMPQWPAGTLKAASVGIQLPALLRLRFVGLELNADRTTIRAPVGPMSGRNTLTYDTKTTSILAVILLMGAFPVPVRASEPQIVGVAVNDSESGASIVDATVLVDGKPAVLEGEIYEIGIGLGKHRLVVRAPNYVSQRRVWIRESYADSTYALRLKRKPAPKSKPKSAQHPPRN